jgi:deoxycytidylate deaminase
MPDLKDERAGYWTCTTCGGQFPTLAAHRGSADRCSSCVAVDHLRANLAAEQAARERAQQALREIEDKVLVYLHSQVCPCATCAGLRTIAAIARKGQGDG